jgi:hypothetical protein
MTCALNVLIWFGLALSVGSSGAQEVVTEDTAILPAAPPPISPPPMPPVILATPPVKGGAPALPPVGTGLFRVPPGVCALDPADVCAKLGKVAELRCERLVITQQSQCRSVQAVFNDGTHAACHVRCDHDADQALMAHDLLTLVQDVINDADPATSEATSAERTFLEDMAARTRQDLAALEAEVAAARITLYSNTETGAVIQHDGPPFVPQPPLVLVGDMARPPTEAQVERLAILRKRLKDTDAEYRALLDRSASSGAWRAEAMAVWFGDGTPARPYLAGCTRAAAETERARCKAFCDAQPTRDQGSPGPHPIDICRPNGVMGLLYQPGSRVWLYPPNDPRRVPGFGR